MTLFRSLLCLAAAGALLAQQSSQQPTVTLTVENPRAQVPPDRVVVSAGDIKITAAQFDQIIESLPEPARSSAKGPQFKQFGEQLVRVLVLSQEGKRRKVDETPSFQVQSMVQTANLLAALTFDQINKDIQIGDQDLRKYYDAHKGDYEQIKARNILIRVQGARIPVKPGQMELTESEALAKAQGIRKRILAGEDFALLAMAESDDTPSASKGGDVGTVKRGQMLPAFEDAAFAMKPGEISEPVRSSLGFHIIQLESRTVGKSFDEVKLELERKLRPEAAAKALEDLVRNGATTMDPEFFGLTKQ